MTKDSAIELRSDSAGSRLTTFGEGKVTFQQPVVASIPGEVCVIYRELRDAHPDACRDRFTESACSACLDQQ